MNTLASHARSHCLPSRSHHSPHRQHTRAEALRLYTTNKAFLLKNEQRAVRPETGKLAGMILTDRDPRPCPIGDLMQTQVLKTWLGGKVVFEN